MHTLSHLERAVLRTLDTEWMTRAQFDEKLQADEWIQRNLHRLARLESTLAGLT